MIINIIIIFCTYFFGSLKLKQACAKHGGRSGNIPQGMDMAGIFRAGTDL
jgi:hypothetical protein